MITNRTCLTVCFYIYLSVTVVVDQIATDSRSVRIYCRICIITISAYCCVSAQDTFTTSRRSSTISKSVTVSIYIQCCRYSFIYSSITIVVYFITDFSCTRIGCVITVVAISVCSSQLTSKIPCSSRIDTLCLYHTITMSVAICVSVPISQRME